MPSVFSDIVGTCFGYDAPREALDERLGPKLREVGIDPKLFFHALQVECERDEVYMVLAERPPISLPERWKENLPRVLFQAGLSPEQIEKIYTEEDIEYVTDTWINRLRPRPGLAEMLQTLKEGGIDFYCASGASPERVKKYFDLAGIEMPESRIVNFLEVNVHKPAAAPYNFIREKFEKEKPDDIMIFTASHAWDLAGASKRGFKTAYVEVYEHYPCTRMWGEPDVSAPDLAQLGKAIVEKWGKNA